MQIWKAHYQDSFHDTIIDILNTEQDSRTNPLSFTLDGVKFEGRSLDYFSLADDKQYPEAKDKFCILKSGGYSIGNHEVPYFYELQGYALDLEIPLKVIRKQDNSEIQGMLHIAFTYTEHDMQKSQARIFCDDIQVYHDDMHVSDFTLCIDGKYYNSTQRASELEFEFPLQDICQQIAQEYYLKCCFTCQYSDYSPYGNDTYGCMLCYCRHKEDCLKVNSKDDFFEYLEGKDFDVRQETYLCSEYAPRNQAEGYRGFV